MLNEELLLSISPEKRAREYVQTCEGLLNPNLFKVTHIPTTIEVSDVDDIPQSLVKLTTVYLYRALNFKADHEDVFAIPLQVADENSDDPDIPISKGWRDKANEFLFQIKGLDDQSIVAAIRLTGFHSYYPDEEITLDKLIVGDKSVANIRQLVSRMAEFGSSVGLKHDPSEFVSIHWIRSVRILIPGVYSHFLDGDTFWKLTVFSPGEVLSKEETLELLIYYMFLSRARQFSNWFSKVTKLGIFDARTNNTFVVNLSDISQDVLKIVADQVIVFNK
ncbi:hypothetical protein MHSWG343_08770 [Candidatus Mycoplasma haematohominis]|uniref:Uncharacterized protein n=1 Tax=Candidatus Mycoplasma haematohominis TaxID=1494318 RepID=A0A478FUZ8_9MOLU|nr:hypothetical protein MHSWG343_08770 [Candidatus Mycoplasma haemohominis]